MVQRKAAVGSGAGHGHSQSMGPFHLGSGLASSVFSSGLVLRVFASSCGVKRHSAFDFSS